MPLLAVVGDQDNLPASRRLSETVPNAQLVILPGEDHLSAICAQAYKDAVAAFLSAPLKSATTRVAAQVIGLGQRLDPAV